MYLGMCYNLDGMNRLGEVRRRFPGCRSGAVIPTSDLRPTVRMSAEVQ